MQVGRTMRIQDTFGIARSSTGITHSTGLVFIHIDPFKLVRSLRKKVFIMNNIWNRIFHHLRRIDNDNLPDGVQTGNNGCKERYHAGVQKNNLVFRMLNDELNLFCRQSDIQRVTYRANTRNRKINFKMLIMIPCKTGYPVAGLYTQLMNQCRCKFFTSFIQVSVGVTMPLTVRHHRDDLFMREYPLTIFNNGMGG